MRPSVAARCAEHLEVAAVDTCQRCGKFVCGDCASIRAEDVYCAACVKLLDRPPPARLWLAFALAAVPLPGIFLLALVGGGAGVAAGYLIALFLFVAALKLCLKERGDRQRGSAPRRGAAYPLAWLALGLDFIVLGSGLFLALATFGARSG